MAGHTIGIRTATTGSALLMGLVLLWGCASSEKVADRPAAEPPHASGTREEGPRTRRGRQEAFVSSGVQYGWLDGRPLLLDVVQAQRPERTAVPAIIFLDAASDRAATAAVLPTRLAEQGKYVCLRITCYNPISAENPADVPECAAALGWLAAHAEDYDVNPNRIGIWLAAAEGQFAYTLERGSTKVVAQTALGQHSGGGRPGPGGAISDAEAFFDRQLRGQSPPPEPQPPQRQGRGRGRLR